MPSIWPLIANLSASRLRDDRITVVEVLAAFWRFAKSYYVKNGKPTNEQDAFRLVIRDIRLLYGTTPAEEFGPKALKAVRQKWIDRGQSRPTVNKNMRRLTRIFKWAVSEELIPAHVHQALATVPGLKKGRCDLPEPDPILPVPEATVNQTLPHLPKIIRDMVLLQSKTGMRPSEVCILRPADIDRSADIWVYRPESHKTEHHERSRLVFIGPAAQKLLLPYLSRAAKLPCFSPQENMTKFLMEKQARRTTPLSCGNRPGTNRKKRPKKKPRDQYDTNSYRQAIHRACDRAFPPPEPLARRSKETHQQWFERIGPEGVKKVKQWQSEHRWSPNQLRHSAATTIRKQFGLEAAQVVLGHAAADVTQVYAERDLEKARAVIREIG